MLKILIIAIFSFHIISSPRSVNVKRAIASNETADSLEILLTFHHSNFLTTNESLYEKTSTALTRFQSKNFKIEFILDNTLPEDVAFKLLPNIDGRLIINYSKTAFFDHQTAKELESFLESAFVREVHTTYAFFEMYFNAKASDAIALNVLSKLRFLAAKAARPEEVNYIKEWQSRQKQALALEQKQKAEKEVQAITRKELMKTLDTAPEAEQFRYLVSINDRIGAAKIIESYLPWEEMSPFEKQFWQTHLEIIRHPVAFEDRVIIYRGLTDDILQTAVVDGKKLSKEEAIRDQKTFVMSTLMTKNQGSWNRRLRSLTSMYKKFIGVHKDSDEFTRACRISTLFRNHSAKPEGSPFLSFTPDYAVAKEFGAVKISAFLIDPRLLHSNYAAPESLAFEREFLLPLVTFPDDLGALKMDGTGMADIATEELQLHKMIVGKLERELGTSKGQDAYKKIVVNTKKYFNYYMKFDPIGASTKVLDGVVVKLPLSHSKTVESCTTLMKLFLH